MKGSRRISVGISADSRNRVDEHAAHGGVSTSIVVRQAIDAYVQDPSTGQNASAKRPLLSLPEELASQVQIYMGWTDCDLRIKRQKDYLELLALAYACKNLYPRTPGMLEGYTELLQLGQFFGIKKSV